MPERFERYPLAFGPTHIEKLARLSERRGGEVEIYAKREDCHSELPFGGNKLRKLEYIIPDAVASSADTLVSIGGAQSNHTRMVAAFAAKIGMECLPVQENRVPHGDAVHDRIGNILFLSSSIAKASPDQAAMARTLQQPRRGVRRDGKSLQSPLRGAAP